MLLYAHKHLFSLCAREDGEFNKFIPALAWV